MLYQEGYPEYIKSLETMSEEMLKKEINNMFGLVANEDLVVLAKEQAEIFWRIPASQYYRNIYLSRDL